jgi:hypothetical protein
MWILIQLILFQIKSFLIDFSIRLNIDINQNKPCLKIQIATSADIRLEKYRKDWGWIY